MRGVGCGLRHRHPSTWVGGVSVFDNESDGCECLGGEEIVHIGGSGEEGAGKSGGCHGVSVDINLPGPIAINEDCGNQLLDVGKGKFVVEDFQGVIPGKGKDTVGHVNGLIDRKGKYRKSITFMTAAIATPSTWVGGVSVFDYESDGASASVARKLSTSVVVGKRVLERAVAATGFP